MAGASAALLHGLLQLVPCILASAALLPAGSAVAAPYYKTLCDSFGVVGAVFFCTALTVLIGQVWAMLLTLPALFGSGTLKIQSRSFPSAEKVLGVMPLVGFNACLSTVVFSLVILGTSTGSVLADVSTDLPDMFSWCCQATASFCAAEVWAYFIHRALHTKWLYRHVHKLHHSWTAPVAIVNTYEHPLEHLLQNIGSTVVGPVLSGMATVGGTHPAMLLSWVLLTRIHTAAGHCGYWTEDLGAHDLHHEKFSVNFGATGVLDFLFGTDGERVATAADDG